MTDRRFSDPHSQYISPEGIYGTIYTTRHPRASRASTNSYLKLGSLKELCHEIYQIQRVGTVTKLSETKITTQNIKRNYK